MLTGVICRRTYFEVSSLLFGSSGRRRPYCFGNARPSSARLLLINTPRHPTRLSASPRLQRFAASALQTGGLGNPEYFQLPGPAESKDVAIDAEDEYGLPCIVSRRGMMVAVIAAALCAVTVGPPPGLAAENTSVLVGIQRYRQRQYVAEQGRLSDEEVLEALQGWQLVLDMVEAAALRGDTIYLRSALTTGVLDFPTLDAAMDKLTNPDGGSAALSKVKAGGWRQAAQDLKKSVLEQLGPGGSPQEIAQQIAVSRDALEPIREAVEGTSDHHRSARPP